MIRVAIVDPATWSAAYDLPLAEALARAGCSVTVHCAKSPHIGLPTSRNLSVTVTESFYRRKLWPLPRRAARALRHPVDLSKLIRKLEQDADLVHVQWLPVRKLDIKAWGELAKRMPVTYTAHNAQERSSINQLSDLKSFTEVITHSDGGKQALQDAGITNVWRTRIGAYTQYAQMSDPVLTPISISPTEPLILFAGLLRKYKGIDVLLEAWPLVRKAIHNARLVIAGRPVDADIPDNLPAGVEVISRFISEEELGWLLRRADVCALPYKEIDMSGIAVSALACATPIVASNIGGMSEYLGNGAVLVPKSNSQELAATLIRVITEPGLQERLTLEAQAAIKTTYSWDTIAQEYLNHYKTLLPNLNE